MNFSVRLKAARKAMRKRGRASNMTYHGETMLLTWRRISSDFSLCDRPFGKFLVGRGLFHFVWHLPFSTELQINMSIYAFLVV